MREPKRYDSLQTGLYTDLLSLGQEFERFVVPALRRGKTAEVVVAAHQVEIVGGKDRLADLQTLLVEIPAMFQIVLLVVDDSSAVAEMRVERRLLVGDCFVGNFQELQGIIELATFVQVPGFLR